MRTWVGFVLVILAASGCVYPRRATSLTSVRSEGTRGTIHAPDDIWQLTIVEALVQPRMRGDLSWDDDGGLPDVYVRIYRNDELIFQSERIEDTLHPVWNVTLDRNVRLPRSARLRFEVWDGDAVGGDPVGIHRSEGLPPTAVPGADARILLEGGAQLAIRIMPPVPQRGVGIGEYELRPEELLVTNVLPFSPAARAGIEAGDRIVAIGDRRVSALSDAEAASELSMAVSRGRHLTVVGSAGRERDVTLDSGFVWLTR